MRNGNGIYNAPSGSWKPATNGNSATAADWNATLSDIEAALTQSVSSDGQTPMTGDLDMGANKLSNLAAGVANSDAVRLDQLTAASNASLWQNNTYTAFTTAGTGSAYTLTATPDAATYQVGQSFNVTFHAASSGTPTIAIDAQAPKNLVYRDATGAKITVGELLPVNWRSEIFYDGVDFIVQTMPAALPTLPALPRGYHQGFILSTPPTPSTDMTIGHGECKDSTNTSDIRLLTAITKTNGAWAVGGGAGGGDDGVVVANMVYRVYAIRRADTGVVDVIRSRNATSPILPPNYTEFRKLPELLITNPAGNFDRIIDLSEFETSDRQTVLSGPVDANGVPNFGGATGGTAVNSTGVLIASAANGFGASGNRLGLIANPSWTGLNTNGTRQLFLEIAADGTCTTSHSNLFTIYQRGGAYSNASGQHVFNISEMQMRVGNGASNTQVWRVPVGEVTIAGGVVTAIRWYALRGEFSSASVSTLPAVSTQISYNHNLGVQQFSAKLVLFCLTAEHGFAAGETLTDFYTSATSVGIPFFYARTALTVSTATSNNVAFATVPKAGGAPVALTAASWSYGIFCKRDW